MSDDSPVPTTKADLLVWLYGRLRSAQVPASVLVTRRQWITETDVVLKAIGRRLDNGADLIVRSSAKVEDQVGASQAGRFLTVANVSNETSLKKAIDDVFASYVAGDMDDVVFVQNMLKGASTVGVAFTADPATGSPYLLVSYAENANTDVITSGIGNYSTWIAIADGLSSPPIEDLRKVPPLITELTKLLKWKAIDIEFAVVDQVLYVLQARPLDTARPSLSKSHLIRMIEQAQRAFDRWAQPHPWLVGSSTLLGVMPDWNPAEIIGVRPRPLALSLYQFLVTDRLWSTQRALYGYRSLPGVPLLVELNGQPFIDVRASLNSLIPASLEDKIAERLVNSCVRMLSEHPELHDKLEFRVLPTCLSFDTASELEKRFGEALNDDHRMAIVQSLRDLTASLLANHSQIAASESDLVEKMVGRRKRLRNLSLDLPTRINWLLVDCAEFGTRPFVGQARRAFIATELLRSLVRGGAIAQADLNRFMRSLNTIARRFQRDQQTCHIDELAGRYGHLRPGTYDIRSPRYDEAPELFLRPGAIGPLPAEEPFILGKDEEDNIQQFLDSNQIAAHPTFLFQFARESIEDRESSKFAFTQNLSDALEALVDFGRELGFDRDALSFLRISDFFSSCTSAADAAEVLGASIERGRSSFQATTEVLLPSLIRSRTEMVSFVQSDEQPNFVGDRIAVGGVQRWTGAEQLSQSILFIENADPGYDWIFGQGLAAFVTMYGGANSHMAIRAHELGVPAVIGAGPSLYHRWLRARVLRIDPANRKVEVIQ